MVNINFDELNKKEPTIKKGEAIDEMVSGYIAPSESEMSDNEFNSWLTLGKEFSNEYYRNDETMQRMLILTKIEASHIDKKLVTSNMEDIISIIQDNINNLIGNDFMIVYIENESEASFYNILYRKNNIALIGRVR